MFEQAMSQTKKMREQFRVAIRKEKKQQIFKQLRNKQRTLFIEQEQERMKQMLDTREKREDWILRKGRQLAGEPEPSWRFVINELMWSLLCFKGNGCFKIWIQTSIIKSLCSLFQNDHLELGLGPIAAKLLGNVIYYEEEQEQEKTSLVGEEILNQNVIQNIVYMVSDDRIPHNQISYLVMLIGNLFTVEPGVVVKAGGLTACVDWSLRMLREKQINRAYLDQIYTFFELMAPNTRFNPNNYNFSNQVFKLSAQFIQIEQSILLLRRLLEVIRLVIMAGNTTIYSNFMQRTSLVKKMFQLSVHDHEIIREVCWLILGYASIVNNISDLFLNYNVIELMIKAYHKEPLPNGRFDKITANMLTCIGNLSSEGDYVKEKILYSPLVNIIYDSTHPDRSINLKKSAFSCICNLMSTNNYNLVRRACFDTHILDKMIFGIEDMMDKDIIIVKETLQVLRELIADDQQVIRHNEDGLMDILQSRYHLSNLLIRLQQKHPSHAKIQRLCSEIIDLSCCI